jgi:CDP-diacylglycerol--serine O-phosphatidyltransferase
MKSWRSLIPNLLTLSNLACGLIALLAIFNEAYLTAAWLMVASLFFDFLDGMTARLLKVNSDLGMQLDSLADLVSFGLSPGFLMFHIIMDYNILNDSAWLSFTALAIPLLSAWRLAVFNIDHRQTNHFIGLPTPANAIMIFAIALFPEYAMHPGIENFLQRPLVLSIISLVSAVLLVAPIPMQSLKFKSLAWQPNQSRYLLLLAILILLLVFGVTALVFVIPLYLVISIIFKPSAA